MYDKTRLLAFVQGLTSLNWEIISTGGTAKHLREAGFPILDVSQVTGFPECLEGRLKTLHPKILGGILAKGTPEHKATLKKLEIEMVDMVVVNLYPFEETVAKPDTTWDQAIEQIDIGGPTMIRAAAKNHNRVTVIVDPNDYMLVVNELELHGEVRPHLRQSLAAKVFRKTAEYDKAIADYFNRS
ncbi:MAG: hypothetical protein WC526_03670 [Patescibacteria group bacterium]